MLSSILLTAAMAASVLASPVQHLEKRVQLTEYNVVATVTEVVVVTQTGSPAASAPVVNNVQANSNNDRNGDGSNFQQKNRVANPVVITTQVQSAPAAPAPSSAAVISIAAAAQSSAPAQSSAAVQAASSGDGAPTPPGKGADYKSRILFAHNIHRYNHSAPPLVWDAQLASIAQTSANTCNFSHDVSTYGGRYGVSAGQNIAAGFALGNETASITEGFYNGEVGLYEAATRGYSVEPAWDEKWGHMSQIAWHATTSVGCATSVDCVSQRGGVIDKDGNHLGVADGFTPMKYYLVCNYKAPGNYGGKYNTPDGVRKSKGNPSAHWWSYMGSDPN